ncbi:MAG: FG-GAP repeat domain-containing protein [Verrucomicrobiales bacterium]
MSNAQLTFALVTLCTVACVQAGEPSKDQTFQKIRLSEFFWTEGAGAGDFNRDGHPDVTAGPYWWQGPDFQKRHTFRDDSKTSTIKLKDGSERSVPGFKGALGTQNDYSDNFLTFVRDMNGDGWDDIINVGWPGKAVHWYANPGAKDPAASESHWPKHLAIEVLDNESPVFADLLGNGSPVMVGNFDGHYGYFQPDASKPESPWSWHPITPKGKWHKYTHGCGVGDVNKDGRPDLIESAGWWEQPASLAGDPVWKLHAFPFAPGEKTAGGAQMYAYDFNGDGRNDVLTTLDPHRYGLVWYEQTDDSGTGFTRHMILNDNPQANRHGVAFSQMHAIEMADMNGDGLLDVVTGKRYWAHGPGGDVDPEGDSVVYWFRATRGTDGAVDFVPHRVDSDSGVGTQFSVADLNRDGKPDIVTANKRGIFVFIHGAESAAGK